MSRLEEAEECRKSKIKKQLLVVHTQGSKNSCDHALQRASATNDEMKIAKGSFDDRRIPLLSCRGH